VEIALRAKDMTDVKQIDILQVSDPSLVRGLFVRDRETSVRIGLRGGPESSDTRQSGQWLACQTAQKGPFERKRVSQQVSKLER
jgi:hypothetical protein